MGYLMGHPMGYPMEYPMGHPVGYSWPLINYSLNLRKGIVTATAMTDVLITITAAWAVDREFVSIVEPVGGSVRVRLGSGSAWFGFCSVQVDSVSVRFEFGLGWFRFGSVWDRVGSGSARVGFSSARFGFGLVRGVDTGGSDPPPSTRAGGQDDGIYTNSLK